MIRLLAVLLLALPAAASANIISMPTGGAPPPAAPVQNPIILISPNYVIIQHV